MVFDLPADINGLAGLLGGREALAAKLDAFIGADPTLNPDGTIHEMKEAGDVRMGLHGQSNEPSIHIPYLYNYAGQPWKTQALVWELIGRIYVGGGIGQGYLGDEDGGTMSAWYVFSALGFYPVSVGDPIYAIGSPRFTKATIHLENGKNLVISAPNNSREKVYIQSVKRNGKEYTRNYLTHEDLLEGGTITFEMGAQPSAWGGGAAAAPASITPAGEMPQAAKDLTQPAMSTATRPNYSPQEDQLASRDIPAGDLRALIDNTSATSAAVSGSQASIYFISPSMHKMSIVTVTSGSRPENAPNHAALYGSNDGKSWGLLGERDMAFTWAQYTCPLTVAKEKSASYTTYRLDFAGAGSAMQLAEIEFIGKPDSPTGPSWIALCWLMTTSSLYTAESWAALETAVEAAKKLSAQVSQEQMDKAAQDMEDAIEQLEPRPIPGDMNNDGYVTHSGRYGGM